MNALNDLLSMAKDEYQRAKLRAWFRRWHEDMNVEVSISKEYANFINDPAEVREMSRYQAHRILASEVAKVAHHWIRDMDYSEIHRFTLVRLKDDA